MGRPQAWPATGRSGVPADRSAGEVGDFELGPVHGSRPSRQADGKESAAALTAASGKTTMWGRRTGGPEQLAECQAENGDDRNERVARGVANENGAFSRVPLHERSAYDPCENFLQGRRAEWLSIR